MYHKDLGTPNVKAFMGLCKSGKSHWVRTYSKVCCDVRTLQFLDIALESNSIESHSIGLLNFGDSWDRFQIETAFDKIRDCGKEVYLELHNTNTMCLDYLPHECYYLCESHLLPPLPIQQCTHYTLTRGHNIHRMFVAGAFKYPL